MARDPSTTRDPAGRAERGPGPEAGAKRARSGDGPARVAPVVLVVGGLVAWQLAAGAGKISTILYPPPSAVAVALGEMARDGLLATHLGASLVRVLLGFATGGGIGLLLGLAMGWSRPLRLALDPLVAAAHPVPRLALLPLVLLVFGVGETSRVIVVAISCFFPMLINAVAGVRQIEPVYFEVARNFGAGRAQVLAHVVLPGSLPSVAAGTRLAIVRALKTTIGIELITAQSGLGHLVWLAWETFHTDDLYAALVVVAVVGFSMNAALERLVALTRPTRELAR